MSVRFMTELPGCRLPPPNKEVAYFARIFAQRNHMVSSGFWPPIMPVETISDVADRRAQ
jgi:hypothetical protein